MKWWEVLLTILGILIGSGGISTIFITVINNKHKSKENAKNREHESIENEKDRQNRLKVEEYKIKRLELQLKNTKDIEREKLKKENSNSPSLILDLYRKGRKGKQ